MAPKVELPREPDRKGEEPPAASGPPRRARKIVLATTIFAIFTGLGIGWGTGVKTPELMNGVELSVWYQDTASAVLATLDAQRKRIVAASEGVASPPASTETIGGEVDAKSVAAVIEAVARGLFVRMDQLGASSARDIAEVGSGLERYSRLVEHSQRELIARLDALLERLERLESQAASAARTSQAKPPEKPAERPLPLQLSPPALTGSASRSATSAIRRIESWAVRDVVDGMAILAGPVGLIGVSSGDVVPGVGRVESISRRGARWVVSTSTGVITGR